MQLWTTEYTENIAQTELKVEHRVEMYMYDQRVVRNQLPSEVVSAPSLERPPRDVQAAAAFHQLHVKRFPVFKMNIRCFYFFIIVLFREFIQFPYSSFEIEWFGVFD